MAVSATWLPLLFAYVGGPEPVRIVVGFIAILFAPGYSLLGALYLGQRELDIPERIGISLGLSIVISTVAGFILSYTPWGIDLDSILLTVASVVTVLSALALIRRWIAARGQSQGSHQGASVTTFPSVTRTLLRYSVWLGVIGAVLGSALVIYREQKLTSPQRFTEFAVLDASGKAEGYSTTLTAGIPAQYTVSVVNREGVKAKYRVQIRLAGRVLKDTAPVILEDGEKWLALVDFVTPEPVRRAQLEFTLLKGGEAIPVRMVVIWVTVRNAT